ncbi:Uncharacterised protein [Mycobacteroides abscessus subsp. abscessus]|nr:Uncharacterised protein [Mycobacteroides abscessus subsp. abscessus]
MAPSSTRFFAAMIAGWNRVHIASIAKTPRALAMLITSCAPETVAVKVFSTRMALPAVSAAIADWRCWGCGVAMYTTSMSGSASSSRYEP